MELGGVEGRGENEGGGERGGFAGFNFDFFLTTAGSGEKLFRAAGWREAKGWRGNGKGKGGKRGKTRK